MATLTVDSRTEISPHGAGVTAEAPTLQLPEARRRVGLEATWEIDALVEGMRSLTADLGSGSLEPQEAVKLSLQLRGMTARIVQLNSVAMSVLDEDDDTASLERKVHGNALATVFA